MIQPADIHRVTDPELLTAIGRLRVEVWQDLLNPAAIDADGAWLDRFDAQALHWAALSGGEVVAAARLTFHHSLENIPDLEDLLAYRNQVPLPLAYLGRLVVKREFRGPGVAEQFDRLRLEEASRLGARTVYVTPTSYRVRSLERFGFQHLGRSPVDPETRFQYPALRIAAEVMLLDQSK